MNEAELTVGLLNYLDKSGWVIVCYDFPQSGTGLVLHSNKRKTGSKNDKSVIPDIVAIKDGIVLFFENKEIYTQSDFDKINFIKNLNFLKKNG